MNQILEIQIDFIEPIIAQIETWVDVYWPTLVPTPPSFSLSPSLPLSFSPHKTWCRDSKRDWSSQSHFEAWLDITSHRSAGQTSDGSDAQEIDCSSD